MTTALAIILENGNGKVLLQHRDDTARYFPGYWSIFTRGMKETDESPLHGIIRGVGEELKVKYNGEEVPLDTFDLKLFKEDHFNNYDVNDDEAHKQDCDQFVFTGKLYTPRKSWLRLTDLVLKEGQNMQFFDRLQIRRMDIAANYGRILEEYFLHRCTE